MRRTAVLAALFAVLAPTMAFSHGTADGFFQLPSRVDSDSITVRDAGFSTSPEQHARVKISVSLQRKTSSGWRGIGTYSETRYNTQGFTMSVPNFNCGGATGSDQYRTKWQGFTYNDAGQRVDHAGDGPAYSNQTTIDNNSCYDD